MLQHETRHFAMILEKQRDREKTELLHLLGTATFSSQLPHDIAVGNDIGVL